MLVINQGNIGNINNNLLINISNILYTGVGGKATMSLVDKNIPPMKSDDLPDEILIKEKDNRLYKIDIYNKNCYKNSSCTNKYKIFRFQLIYDGYDSLYYPEFKLLERPYIVLENNVLSGTNALIVHTDKNDLKNITLFRQGDVVNFVDYNHTYTISSITPLTATSFEIQFSQSFIQNYNRNDIFINTNRFYEDMTDSNLYDSTHSRFVFKFKFYNDSNNDYEITSSSGVSNNEYILSNNDTTTILDLFSTKKIASISHNINENPSSLVLNGNITPTTEVFEFTTDITDIFDVGSYFTLKNQTNSNIEIVRVVEIQDTDKVKVERGQLNTTPNSFDSASTDIYVSNLVYYVLLPYNNVISGRYVLLRNIDLNLALV